MAIDIPLKKTLEEIGLDQFGQSPLSFVGSQINLKKQTMYEAGVPSNFIQDGDVIRRLNLIDGWMQSADFVTGVSGWRIRPEDVEFGSGYFRGDITGASGTFSGSVTVGSGTDFNSGYDPSKKINTFAQASIPTSLAVGDLWVDTDDRNKLYRAASVGADAITAGEWVLYNDTRAADAVLKAGTGQTITGNFNLNSANVLLDGANKRIVINDGTNDRVLIGYLSGKF